MAGAVPVLYWFDRFDERIGVLPVVGALVHAEELNGEDTLEFCLGDVPSKGDRLLWLDGDSWREHVVVRTVEPVGGLCDVYAESSLCELLCDFIEDMRPTNKAADQALELALSVTRWKVGVCDVYGIRSCWFYHTNALAALRRISELWDGEASVFIEVEDGHVTARSINLLERIGGWRGIRFTYGKNMTACTRTVLDEDVYTALYGYGAGLPAINSDGEQTGGYRRKLNFGELNGGVNWIGDEDARVAA